MPKTRINKRHLDLPLLPVDVSLSPAQIVSSVDTTLGLDWKTRDTAAQIKNKLETLAGINRLDASAIRNLPSGGSGAVASVNTQTGIVVLDTDDISDTTSTNKYFTVAERNKLAGIEENATDGLEIEEFNVLVDVAFQVFTLANTRLVKQVLNNGISLKASEWSQNTNQLTVTPTNGGLFADGYIQVIK